MELLNEKAIWQFANKHPAAESPLQHWVDTIKTQQWNNPADVARTFNSADNLGNDRWIFNIGGNNFRLAATVWFKKQRVFVLKVMTHFEYDQEEW